MDNDNFNKKIKKCLRCIFVQKTYNRSFTKGKKTAKKNKCKMKALHKKGNVHMQMTVLNYI